MWATHYTIVLANFCGYFRPRSIYYFSKDEAYQILKDLSQQDFGDDKYAWEKWGLANGKFLDDWKGLDTMLGLDPVGPRPPLPATSAEWPE